MALLDLTAHWIGIKGDTYHVLLGLRHLYGAHTGENQAQVVLTLLQEYELCQKVGYFTLDNASNNDKALQFLAQQLKDFEADFNPIEQRLRCMGHVINLVVQAFLHSTDIEEEGKVAGLQASDWRKRGTYGRLRNIITYITWTPQRREEFTRLI